MVFRPLEEAEDAERIAVRLLLHNARRLRDNMVYVAPDHLSEVLRGVRFQTSEAV